MNDEEFLIVRKVEDALFSFQDWKRKSTNIKLLGLISIDVF